MAKNSNGEWVHHKGTGVYHLDTPSGEHLVFQDNTSEQTYRFSVETVHEGSAFISTDHRAPGDIYCGINVLLNHTHFLDELNLTKAGQLKKRIESISQAR